ncbi:MAG: hypothetical protein J7K72_02350, partial [Candidatus Aenigmarchaeota archaeon]|nr:hypothetical protein [Candidatus Aenigmarchaeota archaeon]
MFKDLISCDRRIRDKIRNKRLGWLEENYERVSKELKNVKTPVEKAFRLVFLEYMRIDPNDLEVTFIPDGGGAEAIYIYSKNFCPYLE